MERLAAEGSVHDGAAKLKEYFLKRDTEEQKADQPEKESEAEDQQTEDSEEDTSEQSEEEDESDDDSEDDDPADLIEFNAGGKTHKLDLDEVKKLAAAGFDYTKKSQELANEKTEAKKLVDDKIVELEKNRQGLIEATELVQSVYAKPLVSDEKLAELLNDGNTEEYLRLKGEEDKRQQLLVAVKAANEDAKKQQESELTARIQEDAKKQATILLEKIPELKEEETQKKLLSFMKSEGLTDKEIGGLYDARFLGIVDKARRYDELMKKGVTKPKKKVSSPNVTKKKGLKTSKATKKQSASQARVDQFKKTGSIRDAAALYKQEFLN